MDKEKIYIGCSGFYNSGWKGSLFPEDAKSKDFLTLYAKELNCVEINSTFYRKPTAKTLLKWFVETADDFKFFIKIPKTISHEKRLKECREEILDFCSHIQSGLEDKLAGFLYQFPPSFKNTQEYLDLICSNLDLKFLNVIEFRHESWWENEIFQTLKQNNIVFSGVSFPSDLPEDFIINNSDVLYYRLHGKPVLYKSEYSDEYIENLAGKIRQNAVKAFIFFNNTWGTAAIKNSLYLKRILED